MKLKEPTKICKLCFKPIKEDDLVHLVHKNLSLCSECFEKLEPKYINFKIDGIEALAIYEYDDNIESLLYQFKGCFDIELFPIFLERFPELQIIFDGYFLIPAPSYGEADNLRGFNHVEKMFSILKKPFLKILEKTDKFKQADHNQEERQQIEKYIRLTSTDSLKGKSVLIVDDVYTTGSTIRAIIKLIKGLNPKRIKVLVMSKTILKPYTK